VRHVAQNACAGVVMLADDKLELGKQEKLELHA
jgi:hypothetical protein